MAKTKAGAMGLIGPDQNWQAENDLRTLMEAEAIEGDPKRFAAAQKVAKQKLIDLASVVSEKASD